MVTSRNRLFSAVSMNEFTQLERENGALEALVAETMAIGAADSMEDCIARLRKLEDAPAIVTEHPRSAIAERMQEISRGEHLLLAPSSSFGVHCVLAC